MNQIKYAADNPFLIADEESATEFLRYFNAFHDGFIKRMLLESNDKFTQDDENNIMSRSQTMSSEVTLRMDIAHNNYGAGDPPVNRVVCLIFRNFYDLKLNIDVSNNTDWAIFEIKFNKVSRLGDSDPFFYRQLFEFVVVRSIYSDFTGWSQVEESLFKFPRIIAWEEDL